ncbi:predicted protein [Postia placenta Mad-698-R]|nr:predicted protein [Postia placenta Mad-698-R]
MMGVGEDGRDLSLRADLSGEHSVRTTQVGSPLSDHEYIDEAEEGRTSISCGTSAGPKVHQDVEGSLDEVLNTGLNINWQGNLHRIQWWWYDAYVQGSRLITRSEITGSIRKRRRRNHISFVRPALLLERRRPLLQLNIHRAGYNWNLEERHLDRRGRGYDRCVLWYETSGKRLLSMSTHHWHGWVQIIGGGDSPRAGKSYESSADAVTNQE